MTIDRRQLLHGSAAGAVGIVTAGAIVTRPGIAHANPPKPLAPGAHEIAKLPFDPVSGFSAIGMVAMVPNVMVVHPSLPARTVPEFIALARKRPGDLSFGTSGVGSPSHMSAELFKSMAGGLQIAHVPSGQADMMFENLDVALPPLKAGKLRALAVTSVRRYRSLPDVPTVAETLPGFEPVAWFGIVGPPKTPRAVAEKVASGVEAALRNPDILRRLSELSADPLGTSPTETAAFMKTETERWSAVVRSAGVKPE